MANDSYAGIKIWIGDKQVVRYITCTQATLVYILEAMLESESKECIRLLKEHYAKNQIQSPDN